MRTVLLDIGGVLVSDPWQSIILTPGRGLADRLSVDRALAERVGNELWRRYSLQHSTAESYWREFSDGVGIEVPPPNLLAQLERTLLLPTSLANTLLATLRARNLEIGIISDTTSFWFPRQAELVMLERYVQSNRVFLSYVHHRNKKATSSLFEVATAVTDPQHTLVIDDREHNVVRARSFGFLSIQVQAVVTPTAAT